MRRTIGFCSIVTGACMFLALSSCIVTAQPYGHVAIAVFPPSGPVVINEIVVGYGSAVELSNLSGKAIDVCGWRVYVNGEPFTIRDYTGSYDFGCEGTEIPRNGYAIITDPGEVDVLDYVHDEIVANGGDVDKVVVLTVDEPPGTQFCWTGSGSEAAGIYGTDSGSHMLLRASDTGELAGQESVYSDLTIRELLWWRIDIDGPTWELYNLHGVMWSRPPSWYGSITFQRQADGIWIESPMTIGYANN